MDDLKAVWAKLGRDVMPEMAMDQQVIAAYKEGNLDAAVPINGIGLPGGLLRVGHVYVDNPNSVAVRVSIVPTTSLAWSRGRRNWINPIVNPVAYTAGCQPAQTLDGACYPFRTPKVEDVALDHGLHSLSARVRVLIDGTDPGPCSGCATNERELAPGVTADVWLLIGPYVFLWSDYALGRLTNPNVPVTAIGSAAETYITWVSPTFALFSQAWWYLTRIAVTPSVRTTLRSRPADSRATLAPALGTDTASFTTTPSLWSTSAPGEGSF